MPPALRELDNPACPSPWLAPNWGASTPLLPALNQRDRVGVHQPERHIPRRASLLGLYERIAITVPLSALNWNDPRALNKCLVSRSPHSTPALIVPNHVTLL